MKISFNKILNYVGKAKFWILSSKGKKIKVQRAKHNEFVESGLETRL